MKTPLRRTLLVAVTLMPLAACSELPTAPAVDAEVPAVPAASGLDTTAIIKKGLILVGG